MKPLVKIKNLQVSFDGEEILRDISFEIYPRDIISIIGPNGSGKSTLLKAIIGIIGTQKGKIEIEKNIKIGYLPQRFSVDKYLPMTVGEFLQLKPKITREQIKNSLKEVELQETFLDKTLAVLSSGQMQKILIAWVIADGPDLILFDEPTENIDMVGQKSVYELLHKLQQKLGVAIVIVSHDLTVVYKYSQKVICLNRKIFCVGPPKKALSSKTLENLYGEHAVFKHNDHHYETDQN